jgi:hypothetical protein
MTKLSVYGTKASFEYDCTSIAWADQAGVTNITDQLMPGIKPQLLPSGLIDVARRLKRMGLLPQSLRSRRGVSTGATTVLDVGPYQPVHLLPKEYAGLENMGGEWGTNYFMINEFIRACATGAKPPNNVWQAARYTVPGIIAHESAVRGGELLPIPDFGEGPD